MNARSPHAPSRRVASLALGSFLFLLSACGTSSPEGTGDAGGSSDGPEAVSAEAGIAARNQQAAAIGRTAADGKLSADASLPVDCGIGGEAYEPTAEELAAANADTEALVEALETAGFAYTLTEDDLGFLSLEWDYANAEIQAVIDQFWTERYPPEPLPAEEVERLKAENDRLAAALDAVGAGYTRRSDASGAEWMEWDYENPEAQAAVEAVYAELYPPIPPTEEELATVRADADRLAAAFDAAGIDYVRMVDDLGWEWVEWDYDDPEIAGNVDAVFNELYPVAPLPEGTELCEVIDSGLVDGE